MQIGILNLQMQIGTGTLSAPLVGESWCSLPLARPSSRWASGGLQGSPSKDSCQSRIENSRHEIPPGLGFQVTGAGKQKEDPGLPAWEVSCTRCPNQQNQILSFGPFIQCLCPGLQVPLGVPGSTTSGPQKRPKLLGGSRSLLCLWSAAIDAVFLHSLGAGYGQIFYPYHHP